MVFKENSTLSEHDQKPESNVNKSDLVTRYVSYGYNIECDYSVEQNKNYFLSVAYNLRQKLFVLLDPSGLTTWEWKNTTKKANKVFSFPNFEHRVLTDIIYCKNHNCYFALKGNYTLILLNREFSEICTANNGTSSVLCMKYNPLSDELITCGLDGVKVWYLQASKQDEAKVVKPMANYRIILKKELVQDKGWIKKIDIDLVNCLLYCCTTNDLYVYDLNGNLMRSYKECHSGRITAVIYSPTSKVIITASEDTEIKVWSLAGGFIQSLRGHTKAVTNLLLNPYNSNLIISGSLDGTIKMWSLDVMQLIYELNTFQDEIFWMGFTEEKFLYAASKIKVSVWSLNSFIDFWASVKDKISRIMISDRKNKASRLLAFGSDSTVRIFSRDTAKHMVTLLPMPNLHEKAVNITYNRKSNALYLLLNNNDIWLYYTKTNPANHIGIWNTQKLQYLKSLIEETSNTNIKQKSSKFKMPTIKPIDTSMQNLALLHRAVDYSLVNFEKAVECKCIYILESSVVYYKEEGACCPIVTTFLLLGLQNGNILFCDAIIQDKKYFLFHCNKDPIVQISHDEINNCLVTKVELKKLYHVQYWKLPSLELFKEFYCSKFVTSYSRIDDSIMLGFNDGTVDLIGLHDAKDQNLLRTQNLSDQEIDSIIGKHLKFEHKERIEIVDSCLNMKLFCTCSLDGCIKIWTHTKKLLAEINLNSPLSYACFLNKYGDLIIGWNEHLFVIYMQKIIPELYMKKDDLDASELLSDDSTIIEDVVLGRSTDMFDPLKITIENYLKPFKIEMENFSYYRTQSILQQKNKNKTAIKENVPPKEIRAESAVSLASTLPESFYSTPRQNHCFLPNIDLTLSAHFKQEDVRSYLIELFAKSFKKWNENQFNFPEFGVSPGPTPTPPPPDEPVQENAETPEVNIEIEPTLVEESVVEEDKKWAIKIDDPNTDDKLKERMPPKLQSTINQKRINSRKLLNTTKSSNKIRSGSFVRDNTASKVSSKENARNIVKRPQNLRREKTSHEFGINKEAAYDTYKSRKLLTAKMPSSIKSEDMGSKVGLVGVTREKSFINSRKPTDVKKDIAELESHLNVVFKEVDKENFKMVSKGQIGSKVAKVQNKPPTFERYKTTISKITNLVTNGSNHNLKRVAPQIREYETKQEEEVKDEFIDDEYDLKPQESTIQQNVSSDNTYFAPINSNAEKHRKRMYHKTRPLEGNRYDQEDIEKINSLFRFYYHFELPGSTPRSSTQYLNDNVDSQKKSNNNFANTESNMQMTTTLMEPFKTMDSSTVSQFYDSWLENYEKQRDTNVQRAIQARLKKQQIMKENQKRWLNVIERKNKRLIIGYSNLLTCHVDPGSYKSNKTEKRPKSVTFSDHLTKNSSAKTTEQQAVAQFVHDLSQPLLRQPYLISAIEMEEILEEAVFKAFSGSFETGTANDLGQQEQEKREENVDEPNINKNRSNKKHMMRTSSHIQYSSGAESSNESSDNDDDRLDYDYYNKGKRILETEEEFYDEKLPFESRYPSVSPIKKPDIMSRMNVEDHNHKERKDTHHLGGDLESSSSYRVSFKSPLSARKETTVPDNSTIEEPQQQQQQKQERQQQNEMTLKNNQSQYVSESITKLQIKPKNYPFMFQNNFKSYKFTACQEIKLEYQIPGFPERYLLPIRFPILHSKIVASLLAFKDAYNRSQMIKN